ncbi:hypothetical protein LSH36_139g01060 [Paralvinella palmiformis]|uniref:Protein FAM183A n=1 Tax=Paralvinella palmiformis TaxID=53620 RepID=A0AAD9NAJ8_9ANNE|nr:hypothetical protein LSH36_139g01060 [Paralvinella palmiformis]
MAQAKEARKPADMNYVHQEEIMKETIRKERKHYQAYTNFSINPFKPVYAVTGKPNSFLDAKTDLGQEDVDMKKVIELSKKPPVQKLPYPETSSQEYGWISEPLIHLDRNDGRLYRPRRHTDVMVTKEAEWLQKEQSVNLN